MNASHLNFIYIQDSRPTTVSTATPTAAGSGVVFSVLIVIIVVQRSKFLATERAVPGSSTGASRYSEKYWV
jgi:UDP-N-acetylmuramyl pentapeptide phosphotransferase/UDP-N-acetylglucosamine-1-phosphate transferase